MSNKRSVSKDVIDRLYGNYYKGRHICSTCHRVSQYGHFHAKKRAKSARREKKKKLPSPKKKTTNSVKKDFRSGSMNHDLIKKKSPKKQVDDGELEYVSLELRPCSEKISLHSMGISALDMSLCDESIQFKYEEKGFEQ